MSSKEEVIVVAGREVRIVAEVWESSHVSWFARGSISSHSENEAWMGLNRSSRNAAERDRDLMLSALQAMADDYVAPAPEQSQALTSALMEVERYRALHRVANAGWRQANMGAREADRALRVMSLRLHDVETALARVTAERDEARRALGVRDGGAS